MTQGMREAIAGVGTILAAVAGGALFQAAGMPVAWMAGPMITVAALAMMDVPVRMSPLTRDFGLTVAGVSLGSTVTPEAVAMIARYPVSILGLAISVIATVAASKSVLERMYGWDKPTAFLAAVPGALSMVMALAAESAGDARKIAVVQAVRLFALVTLMPLAINATMTPQAHAAQPIVTPLGMLVMFLATIAVSDGLKKLKFANPQFVGGMITGTLLHMTNLVPGELPPVMGVTGMVLIGVFSGLRFGGTSPRFLLTILMPGILSLSVALVIALACGLTVQWLTGLKLAEVLVAFAPGGVEAMIMMGAAMGLDTLYISTHHVLRTIALNLVTPFFAPPASSDEKAPAE